MRPFRYLPPRLKCALIEHEIGGSNVGRGNDPSHDSPHQNLTLLAIHPPLVAPGHRSSYDEAVLSQLTSSLSPESLANRLTAQRGNVRP